MVAERRGKQPGRSTCCGNPRQGIVVAGKGPAYEHIIRQVGCTPVPSGTALRPGRLLLSVQYDRIVTAEQLGDYGQAVNLHFGPLPELRGCFPTKWAIINNEPAGVTLHHMTPGIDDGPVIDRATFRPAGMTDFQVYQRCNRLAVEMFERWLPQILTASLPEGESQDESRAKYYRRELPYGGVIPEDADDTLRERLERAFHHPPHAA